jgi:hypothetical protein
VHFKILGRYADSPGIVLQIYHTVVHEDDRRMRETSPNVPEALSQSIN